MNRPTHGYDYPAPLDTLLSLGEPKQVMDYVGLGIGREHVPALIRMATDAGLNALQANDPAVWAPIHACSLLGDLRAQEAVPALVGLFQYEEDDWLCNLLPDVLGKIGEAAIEPVAAYMADDTQNAYSRLTAITSLKEMGERHADLRPRCISYLMAQLKKFAAQEDMINGFLIAALAVDFQAVEAAPLIEQAFAAEAVDETVMGDWEDAQIYLGLKTERDHPRKPNQLAEMGEELRKALGLRLMQDKRLVPVSKSQALMQKKCGRNDPCPCGSGKKYKKCCLNEGDSKASKVADSLMNF